MTKYYYILTLDRSRSTIIDKTLSQELKGISLGEVQRVINPTLSENKKLKIIKCSCGKLSDNCEFWRNFVSHDLSCREKVFRDFVEENDLLIIDSSKTIKRLNKIKDYDVDLQIIVPIRNFNDWFLSVKAARKRNSWETKIINATNKLSAIRLNLRYIKVLAFFEFVITYIRFYLILKKFNLLKRTYIILSNEDLENFIAINLKDAKCFNKVHIVRGNRNRFLHTSLQHWNDKSLITKSLKWIFQL